MGWLEWSCMMYPPSVTVVGLEICINLKIVWCVVRVAAIKSVKLTLRVRSVLLNRCSQDASVSCRLCSVHICVSGLWGVGPRLPPGLSLDHAGGTSVSPHRPSEAPCQPYLQNPGYALLITTPRHGRGRVYLLYACHYVV